jgi:hypothetical protein
MFPPMWLGCTMLLALSLLGVPASADPALDELVAAYPEHLAGYDATHLIWKDGTRMPLSAGKADRSFDEILNGASISDQFIIPYKVGKNVRIPALNEDPGRIRNEEFFAKMYGDCRKDEVKPHLKTVQWLPQHGGGTLMVTDINGVADRLAAVSRELERLPARLIKFLVPSAGTYNCRPIAETDRLSVHAYGAAIDVNTKYSDYWLWAKRKEKTNEPVWRNRIPLEIVEIFERHGFIWGGKWYHFDTMHFEYRPEIIALARNGWPVGAKKRD